MKDRTALTVASHGSGPSILTSWLAYSERIPERPLRRGTPGTLIALVLSLVALAHGDDLTSGNAIAPDTMGSTWQHSLLIGLDAEPTPGSIGPSGTDVDMIKFDVTEPGSYTLETSPRGSEGVDTFLWLIVLDGKNRLIRMATDDDGGTGRYSRIVHWIPRPGRYFARITSYDGQDTGDYYVRIGRTSLTPDQFEPDDAPHGALSTLEPGQPQARTLFPVCDEDYVALAAEPGVSYTVETFSLDGTTVDTYLEILSPDGATVLIADDDGGEDTYHSLVRWEPGESGRYLIRVSAYTAVSGACGSYGLRVSERCGVKGRVLSDLNGSPIADAGVVWRGLSPDTAEELYCRTDAEGRFQARLPAGRYAVQAAYPGLCPVEPDRSIDLPADGDVILRLSDRISGSDVGDGTRTCWAILAGISNFAGTGCDIRYGAHDAAAMREALLGGLNWSSENIVLLVDDQVTVDSIRTCIEQIGARADADDLFMVYYAGIGTTRPAAAPASETDGLDECLLDAQMAPIRDHDLSAWLQASTNSEVLLVIDASFSGGSFVPADGARGFGANVPSAGSGFDDAFAGLPRMAVLCAAGPQQIARESDMLDHGVLTGSLLEVLGRPGADLADADLNGWLELTEAYPRIRNGVISRESQQDPYLVNRSTLNPSVYQFLPAVEATGSVQAGYSLVSVPMRPFDACASTILGTLGAPGRWRIYTAVPGLRQLDPGITDMDPGAAVMLLSSASGPVRTTGVPVSTAIPFNIGLNSGWNVIATPWQESVPWDDSAVEVVCDGLSLPLSRASQKGWIGASAYGMEGNRSYIVHPTLSPGRLLPWRGYRVYARQSCELVLRTDAALLSTRRSQAPDDGHRAEPAWWVPLRASAGGMVAETCVIGVSSGSDEISEPCPEWPGVNSYAVAYGTDATPEVGPRLGVQVSASTLGHQSWSVALNAPPGCTGVTIEWPDMSRVPDDTSLFLHDPIAGTRTNMRFATSHSIRSASDGSTCCFTISAEPGRQRNACLMSVSVQPVGAAVVQASLHLSDSLSVDATILNIAGRTVRRLVDGKALPAGTSTLSWDRRGDRGTRVPSGRYVLQVVGRAESGAVSNIVRPFCVD